MPEFVLTVARYGFLVLLWIFVFTVVGVIRRDLFAGSRASRIVAAPRGVGVPAAAPAAGGRPARTRRGKVARQLVVTAGALAGTRITLSEAPISIGRAEDSTLVITDDYASSRHARLVPRAGQWYIEDLGSTNGTYLDRGKVTAPTPVPLGVPIRIGRTSLELRP
jgi:pSer/pThr/pTyr-binding forkhead associated (FHA) protein